MKTKTLLLGSLVLSSFLFSQVGVNNSNPQATLDVTAKTTDGSKPEGLIAPRLTGDQIRLGNNSYATAQTGTIIYATSGDSAPAGKTINITAPGYYYFDGNIWQQFSGITGDITNDAWVNDFSNTMVKLGTKSDGSTVRDAGTDFVAKDNGNVGIGTISPNLNLEVVGQPSNASRLDGIKSPIITGAQLRAKNYTAAQVGTLIYVTQADVAPAGQTINVTDIGYYYFNGSVWVRFQPGGNAQEGSSVKKTIYNATGGDPTKTITIGDMVFRFNSNFNGPQIALASNPSASKSLYIGVETNYATNGFEYDANTLTYNSSNYTTFQNVFSNGSKQAMANGERNMANILDYNNNRYYRVTWYVNGPNPYTWAIIAEQF
ncbi:hypothetical protein [Chryseobacterium arthrosphaerae]|uniref:hypothetical protein n=1 Tax=Chryseobacterium arthrosphaerae TaxID=651561 RepID=UPI00241FFCED|nr:hypothetical protein [Chryseobacterium arthrosphaerae]